jgi:hypothetical protein
MTSDRDPDPASASQLLPRTPTRWVVVFRRFVGLLGLIEAVVVIALIPIAVYTAHVFGAAGDRFERALIAAGLLVVVGLLTALVGFSDWSARTIIRSPATRICGVVLVAIVLWATFGIDSTRPLRSLPEANLTYPGAIELGRSAAPAEGGMDAVASARLSRSFVTTDPYANVQAFYRSRLTETGWMGPFEYGSGQGRLLSWRRDGFKFQLDIPDDSATGRFGVTIYGPPQ